MYSRARPRCIHRLVGAVIAFGVASSMATTRLAAQLPFGPTTPRFQEIVRLAQDGYGDSARIVIGRILSKTANDDPSLPEALFTAGTVAKTGDNMHSYLARIVVEYPASEWADKAQLRLAQLSYGNGDMNDVVVRVTRLFTDYPRSAVIPSAALWGARAAFDVQKFPLACDWLNKGLAIVGDDIELKNQLQFSKQRCNVGSGVKMATPVPESLRAGPPPRTTADSTPPSPIVPPTVTPPQAANSAPPKAARKTPPAPASPWRVQVAAISDGAVIRSVIGKIEAAGFRAYTVPGPKGLTKVQAGPFATRAAALAGLPRVKAAVGGSPYVTPAP